MIRTFIKDRKFGWLSALAIFVFIPLVFNFYSFLGNQINAIAGLLPFLAFLLFSLVLKFAINDWIEDAHFKTIRLKEKMEATDNSYKSNF